MMRRGIFDLWSSYAMIPIFYFYRLAYSCVQNIRYMTDANNTARV